MLIYFCESTKIATSCWTSGSTGGCWNPPKKDTPRPKTKKKPQQEGRKGSITIKSNPIPAGWVTHKLENSNSKEVLTLLWRFWTPHQASQPGDLKKGLRIPRESDLEGQRDLIIGLPQDWGKQGLQSWSAQTKSCIHQDPEERRKGAVTPQETEPKLLTSVGGSPVEKWVSKGSPQRYGHWQQQSRKGSLVISPLLCRH